MKAVLIVIMTIYMPLTNGKTIPMEVTTRTNFSHHEDCIKEMKILVRDAKKFPLQFKIKTLECRVGYE